jgi:hypothetical protein
VAWGAPRTAEGKTIDVIPDEPVRCSEDELIRRAHAAPDWDRVGAAAKAELAAVYAADNLSAGEFGRKIATVIESDPVLSELVAMLQLADDRYGDQRTVASVEPPGRPPFVWRCDDPGCEYVSPGNYLDPTDGPYCRRHPAQLLRRTP